MTVTEIRRRKNKTANYLSGIYIIVHLSEFQKTFIFSPIDIDLVVYEGYSSYTSRLHLLIDQDGFQTFTKIRNVFLFKPCPIVH